MVDLLLNIYRLLTNRSGFVVMGYSLLLGMFNFIMGIHAKIEEMITSFDALVMPSFSSAGLNVSPAAFLNTLLPLSECLLMFTAWMVLFLACSAIRIIKSFVPTIS